MVTVSYRFPGLKMPLMTKDFANRVLADRWIAENPTITVYMIESSGAHALNRIFG